MTEPSLAELVGGRAAKSLQSLQITTVDELLGHYPRRYEDRGELTDLASLMLGAEVTVLARVRDVRLKYLPDGRRGPANRPSSRALTTVVITDGRHDLNLKFFNSPRVGRVLRVGTVGLFAGTVQRFRNELELLHPDFEILTDSDVSDAESVERLATAPVPVYPATAKCSSWQIGRAVALVLPIGEQQPDPLTPELRTRAAVIPRGQALRWIHQPQDRGQITLARHRLRWDEAFGLQVLLAQRRAARAGDPAVARPGRSGGLLARFDERMPFELTKGQREVGATLASDLARAHPMARLLQGEVGSGKTVVALRAMLQVVDSGGQCALLAPTEVLAAQHARSLADLLGDLAGGGQLGGAADGTRIALVTGSQGAAARRTALSAAASGEAGIVVGTHALLEEKVQFADLGLIVVDEQHRFGVEQRAALLDKAVAGTHPHLLVMTATPIPRTVAMTIFGDLEVSTLSELPSGRRPLVTHVVAAVEHPGHYARVWERAREEVAAGRQVYVVCPRVDSDDPDAADRLDPELAGEGGGRPLPPAAAVSSVMARLAGEELAGLRLAALTGRLSGVEKDQIMSRFADHSRADGVDVLIATTVIEVGVDVANASLMIVLDADRFGVSQLHQLRGRVGRGGHPGLCLLVTNTAAGTPGRARLEAVASTNNGFELSRYDLAERREGEVLGAAQSGRSRALKLLSVINDEALIKRARALATELVAADPQLADHPELAARIRAMVAAEQAEYLEKS